jgi:uncharacterized membrane protein YoaK (UPF0700 family)
MPIPFLQRLAGRERSRRRNRQLGGVLAFVAGAINAGGFLAVQRYTSHMSGIVSAMADDLAVGSIALALAGLASLLAFVAGAATTTVLISWARRRELQSKYALALLLEAALLLLFGVAGANLHNFAQLLVPSTVLLLCFIMGLQNAIVTKISHAEIRTTHMTGVITDLGIELGRLLYWNRSADTPQRPAVVANRDKLTVLSTLLVLFFGGGVIGALMFKHLGYSATVPFAIGLALLAAPAVWLDVQAHRHHA